MAKKLSSHIKEILSVPKRDRRLLPNVPDTGNNRKPQDRRGAGEPPGTQEDGPYGNTPFDAGLRYETNYKVKLRKFMPAKATGLRRRRWVYARSVDTSASGMLVEIIGRPIAFTAGTLYDFKFRITPGSMPEGFEGSVTTRARVARVVPADQTHGLLVAFAFERQLAEFMARRRWLYSVTMAGLFLFFVVFTVILMRAESLIYFRYNRFLYLYSLIAASFLLTRYLFGVLYRCTPVNPDFLPGVSIIIPCFNEEEWIEKTILGCVDQDYPLDKLEVIVVDDCSNDRSVERIRQTLERLYAQGEHYKTRERVRLVAQEKNGGKREALAAGARLAKHEFVVFVDSDSFLAPTAVRHLVQPFQDPRMGGVTGRTEVENKYTNILTKMQAVRYYIAFRITKAAEAYFDCVTCLSGPISCYRKELVLQNLDAWLGQKFFGQPATFGDDRSMTNLVMRTHRTGYQDTAVCYTIVPSGYKTFLRQQMRWKRSWLRESFLASRTVWKKEPFMSLFFYMGLLVPLAAPVVAVFNLIAVPIAYGVFPTTFLMGLLLMALMMSLADLWFRRSSLWIFGVVFAVFYESVLLWQMPVAWVTFWKSTWGTRLTPEDIEAASKKRRRRATKGRKKRYG